MKISVLNQQHPTFSAELLADIAALYEGGKPWHDRLDVFLPKKELESGPAYAERCRRATYENNVAPILDLMIGWLFESPATVTGLPDDWIANVDGQGTSWSTWWRAIATNAAKDRTAYVWINFPPPADVPPTSAADERQRGLSRPFLVSVPAAMVPNWLTGPTGGLTAVMVRDTVTRQGVLTDPQVTVQRWTAIDGTAISRWEWTPTQGKAAPGPDDEATALPPIAHGRPEIPVVRLDLPAGLHIGGKLRDPAVELAGLANDLDWALHRGAHAVMVVCTADGAIPPLLTAGAYLLLGERDTVTFAEPSGACYDALAGRIEVARQGIYRVAHQMGASVGNAGAAAAASGASKSLDWKALEIVLDAYADAVRAAMLATAKRVADVFRVDPESITVTGLDGWDAADLQGLLTAAALAAPMVKSETFRREIAKQTAASFLDDAAPGVLDTINAELDAADYSDEPVFAPSPAPGAGGGGAGEDGGA